MKVKTYNSKKVVIAFGNHIVEGVADGTFVNIEQGGDGITKVVGGYGEVQRSINPDSTYQIKLKLLWRSPTNTWLRNKVRQDKEESNAIFPVLIKDLVGNIEFSAEEAWAVKDPNIGYGSVVESLEWTIETGQAEIAE